MSVTATDVDLARWRLRSQHLVGDGAATSEHVVRHLLGVQAENPSQSAWAVATRTRAANPDDLAAALADGRVLRTHVLRSTWHYVTADDLVWLVELTSPRVRRNLTEQLDRAHGLSGADRERLGARVVDVLGAGRHLTRAELAGSLRASGPPVTGQVLMLLMADLEMRALVCSGAPSPDGAHTYALVADRVPAPRRPSRDEALGELALRYATSHGPVTARDLAYWATLTLTDARAGLAAAGDRLERLQTGDRTFWHAPGERPPTGPQQPEAHLLQLLDEMYRGYQDSRYVLDAAGAVPRGREAAIGMALVDGQLLAGMRRTLSATSVTFELHPHPSWTAAALPKLERAAERYGEFLGLEPRVRVRLG